MTGSIKDRMALHVLRSSYARGELERRCPSQSHERNTGIAFAAVGPPSDTRPHLHADWMSEERKQLIRATAPRCLVTGRKAAS